MWRALLKHERIPVTLSFLLTTILKLYLNYILYPASAKLFPFTPSFTKAENSICIRGGTDLTSFASTTLWWISFLLYFFLKRDISAVSSSVTDVMLLDSLSKLLEKLCRIRFGNLLLCYFLISPMESDKAPYGSRCYLGASLACEKWKWCLHGQG